MALPFKSDSIVIPSGGAADPRVVTGTADPTSGFAAPEGSIYLRYVASNGQAFVKSGVGDTDWTNLVTAGGTTLDGSYDFGGAGAGRTIVADSGALQVNATTADAQAALVLNRSPTGSAAAVGLELTLGSNANTSSSGVQINDSGTGTSLYTTKLAAGIAHYTSLQHAGAQALVIAVNAAPSSAPPVAINANTDGTTATLLSITKIPSSSTAGAGIGISMGANTTGPAITISAAGTGPALQVSAGAIEMANSSAAVSPANNGRIRYNSGTQTFQASLNGAAYVDIATGAGVAIGASVTGGTVGSVLFVGAGGVLQQDNAGLFWDDTNNALTVANSSSGSGCLQIRNTNASGPVDFFATDSGGTARLSWGYGNPSYSDSARASRGYVWRNAGLNFVFARTGIVDLFIQSDGKLGVGTSTSLTGLLEVNATNPDIYINGSTSGLLRFNTPGVAAPTFTTRSVGTKVVLYPSVGVTQTDYALGIEGSTLWYSIPLNNAAHSHKWYAATTEIGRFQGDAKLVVGAGGISKPTTFGPVIAQEIRADATTGLAIAAYGTSVTPHLYFYRGRGTGASTTPVLANDNIGAINFTGNWSAGDNIFTGTIIRSLATENWGTSANGSKIEFWSTPNGGGSPDRALRMTVDQSGSVLIGAATAKTKTQFFASLEVTRDTTSEIVVSSYGTAVQPILTFFRGRGTAASTTAVLDQDVLGQIPFQGANNATGGVSGAGISALATENWAASSNLGAKLTFFTNRNANGVADRATRLTLDHDGTAIFEKTLSGGVGIDVKHPVNSLVRVIGDSDNTSSDAGYTGYVIARGTTPTELWFIGRDGTTPSDNLIFRTGAATNVAVLTTGGRFGVNTIVPDTAIDGRSSASGDPVYKALNSNTAGYSAIDFYTSANVFRAGFGYGNSAVALTHLQGQNYWYSGAPDFVFANVTRNEFTFGMTSGSTFVQMQSGNSAAVSASSTGRIRYNSTNNRFQVSENGGSYLFVATWAATPITGGVLFGNGSDRVAQDAANFYWDDTNNRLGIGNASPATTLHVTGNSYVDGKAGVGIDPTSGFTTLSAFRGTTGDTAQVWNVINGVDASTVDTTAALALRTAVRASSQASRSAGANDLINIGLYANATNGQTNWAIATEEGDVMLNVTSGITVIGPTAGTGGVLVMNGGSAVAVSAADTGRVRYDESVDRFQVSVNGGAYQDIVTRSVERLSSDGAADPNVQTTFVSGTGTDLTLANGAADGFIKSFVITGGSGTVTPANLADGDVLTWTANPANVQLIWDATGTTWHVYGTPFNVTVS